jgi:hypothetical protein
MEKTLSILAILLAIVALGLIGFNALNSEEVVIPTADEIASKVNVSIVQEVVDNSKLDELYEDYFKDKQDKELQNETAKALVLDEINTKAFRIAIFDLLVEEGRDIDSYKDVTITSVVIKDAEVDGEDAVVTVEIKVNFIEFGDEDESFKAVIKAVFEVESLDLEELDDATLGDFELELLRVRDN